MERREFSFLVKGMKAVYCSPTFIPDQAAFDVWYELLKDIPYDAATVGIQNYMKTNKNPPTIADIREQSAMLVTGPEKDWGDGWGQVLMAIRKYGMYQEDLALESMDELTRRCAKRLGFQNICTSENISADRANFRLIYEKLQQQERMENQRGDITAIGQKKDISKLIEQTTQAMIAAT